MKTGPKPAVVGTFSLPSPHHSHSSISRCSFVMKWSSSRFTKWIHQRLARLAPSRHVTRSNQTDLQDTVTESHLHLFSHPLEIREEIYFHLIMLTFGPRYLRGRYLGRHILNPSSMGLHFLGVGRLTWIFCHARSKWYPRADSSVGRQMKTEVHTISPLPAILPLL
jgi:hypothetical protein